MKKVLIDTNIYSLAMKGDDNVVDTLKKIDLIGFAAVAFQHGYIMFTKDRYFNFIPGLTQL